jgi:hypothetical protein
MNTQFLQQSKPGVAIHRPSVPQLFRFAKPQLDQSSLLQLTFRASSVLAYSFAANVNVVLRLI